MKILQINVVYKTGSTGKIMHNIHTKLLENDVESVICYGRGKKTNDSYVYKVCGELYSKLNNLVSRFTGIMYGGCFFSTEKLINIVRTEKPDVVHLHCLNGYFVNIYRLVSWLKKNKINTVLTLHAEFMHTGNCSHALDCDKWITGCGECPRVKKETKSILFDMTHYSWRKMKKAFEGFDNLVVVSVSPWLMERAKLSPILMKQKHAVILNGLDTNIYRPCDTSELREELGLVNKKVILHVTPYFRTDISDLKGGYYIIKLAELLKTIDVKVVVVGDYPNNIKYPDNIILMGNIANESKLAALYSLADLTVIASRRETFSMVVAESLCCGTPVVGFYAGGPETIAIPEYCKFVAYRDLPELEDRVRFYLSNPINSKECSEFAHKKYSMDNMFNQYEKRCYYR